MLVKRGPWLTYVCLWVWSYRHMKPTKIAIFMGATWGPPGFCQPQVGPMLAPLTDTVSAICIQLLCPSLCEILPVSVCWWVCSSRPWWRHQMETFSRYWPFVRGIHRSPVNSLHKGQWRGALVFSFMCARISGSVNNRDAGDLRCHGAHYDVIAMH